MLTQELVLLAIVAVTSLLLLHYSTKTSFVTVKCWLTNRKDLSARGRQWFSSQRCPGASRKASRQSLPDRHVQDLPGRFLNSKQSSETHRENIINCRVPSSPFRMRVLAAVLRLPRGT